MEMTDAVLALSGLAQESRLTIFRHLVQVGPEGESAGSLATRFGLPAATLSFHLSQLCQCGLLRAQREGRRIVYSADYDGMNRLMCFLTDNCCGGRKELCPPTAAEEHPAPNGEQWRRERDDH
jgi:ArsR family transcriptional regulator